MIIKNSTLCQNNNRYPIYLSFTIPVSYLLTVCSGLFLKGNGFVDLWWEGLIMLVFSTIIITLSSMRFHKRIK